MSVQVYTINVNLNPTVPNNPKLYQSPGSVSFGSSSSSFSPTLIVNVNRDLATNQLTIKTAGGNNNQIVTISGSGNTYNLNVTPPPNNTKLISIVATDGSDPPVYIQTVTDFSNPIILKIPIYKTAPISFNYTLSI